MTGGCGFIGQHIVEELVKRNYRVAVIDVTCYEDCHVLHSDVRYYHADITENLDDIFEKEKPDYVIHLAAQVDVVKSIEKPKLDATINITGTINILDCCYKHSVKKLIYASSAAVYGEPAYLGIDEDHPQNPTSFYGISKHSAELYIKAFSDLHELNYTILRYANVYGPGSKANGNVISTFIDLMSNDKQPEIFGDGNQSRDFIFVKDVANANIAALHRGDRQTINISTGKPTTLNELVKKLNSLLNKNLTANYLPARDGDISQSYLTNIKAHDSLNWGIEYSLERGLQFTLNQDKENLHDK